MIVRSQTFNCWLFSRLVGGVGTESSLGVQDSRKSLSVGCSQWGICRAEQLRYVEVRSLDGQESTSRPKASLWSKYLSGVLLVLGA